MSNEIIVASKQELSKLLAQAVQDGIVAADINTNALAYKKILSPEEVEILYGFKPNTLANWRVAGKGPEYIQEGSGRVYYSVKAIEAYLDSNTKKTYL